MLAFRRLPAAFVFVLLALAVSLPLAPAAAPADNAGTPIYSNWYILDATVTRPGAASQHWGSKRSAAFIQYWYFATLYGSLTEQKPPASLLKSKSTFKANARINGAPYTFTGYYVTNAKLGANQKAWVGLPRQAIGPGAFVPVEKWYIAPPNATLAWQGKLGPVPIAAPATSTTTQPVAAVPESASSGSSWGWILGVGAVGVAIVLAVLLVVRTRRRPAASEPPALS
jgi:hypothetical protein